MNTFKSGIMKVTAKMPKNNVQNRMLANAMTVKYRSDNANSVPLNAQCAFMKDNVAMIKS